MSCYFLIFIHFNFRSFLTDTSKRDISVENGECEALVSTDTRCLEANEHNDEQQKGDTFFCVLYVTFTFY